MAHLKTGTFYLAGNRNFLSGSDKARSALYRNETDNKPLSTIEAFRLAAQFRPMAAQYWLTRLATVGESDVAIMIDNVPRARMSETAAEFARRLLLVNQQRLLHAAKDLP